MELKKLSAKGSVGSVIDDKAVALRVRYKGTGTVTSVVVTAGTSVVLTSSDGGAETFAFATYTTMGTLADKINASSYWKCKLLDCLRTDLTSSSAILNNAGVTIDSLGNYDLLLDTSVCLDSASAHVFTYRVTFDRNFDKSGIQPQHRVRLQEIFYNIDVSGAAANGVRIYEWDASKKTETQVYRNTSVDATDTTKNFAGGNGTLDSDFGNDLIVRIVDATSITNATANVLQVTYIAE